MQITQALMVYISASNKSFKYFYEIKKLNIELIGSAHDILGIKYKNKQGCSEIIFSNYLVDYDPMQELLGVIKFNNLINRFTNLIPLGGIKISNLNKLRMIRSSDLRLCQR